MEKQRVKELQKKKFVNLATSSRALASIAQPGANCDRSQLFSADNINRKADVNFHTWQ